MIESLNAALPEIILAIGGMIALMLGVFVKSEDGNVVLVSRFSSLVLLTALASIFLLQSKFGIHFNGLFILDNFASFVKAIIIFSAAIILILSFNYIEDKANEIGFEYSILILLSVAGMLIMVSSNDLIAFYLGLELQSLALYVIAAMRRNDKTSSEAAIKYFVLGALASGLLLYGVSLVYGFIGTTNLTQISTAISTQAALSTPVLVGLVLISAGLCFKISAAPFHMWTPDVYEGVPTPVTAYFAIVPKLAVIAVIARIFSDTFANFVVQWQQVIIAICVLSMFVGAFGGLRQSNIKRLLAYSSISHMGYCLLGVAAATSYGVQTILAYFVIYILTSIALFAVLISLKVRSNGNEQLIENIDHFKGLARTNPVIGAIVTLSLISLIGLPFPPFPGFFGKFFVFGAAIKADLFWLAVVGVLTSVVSAFYYLRIIKLMFFDKIDDNTRIVYEKSGNGGFIILIATALSFFVFVAPSRILDIARTAAESLF